MTTERHVRSSIREAYRRGSPWIGLILLSSQAMAAQLPSGKTLSSAEIKQALAGKVASGDHHWRYYFKANGSVSGTELGASHTGHWHTRKGQLCLDIPIGAHANCLQVVQEGGKYIFRTDGVDLSEVTIVPYRAALEVE